jgi:hypothetical protein
VCPLGVQGPPDWVAQGMSNSFADTVQAKDGGTHTHVGAEVSAASAVS